MGEVVPVLSFESVCIKCFCLSLSAKQKRIDSHRFGTQRGLCGWQTITFSCVTSQTTSWFHDGANVLDLHSMTFGSNASGRICLQNGWPICMICWQSIHKHSPRSKEKSLLQNGRNALMSQNSTTVVSKRQIPMARREVNEFDSSLQSFPNIASNWIASVSLVSNWQSVDVQLFGMGRKGMRRMLTRNRRVPIQRTAGGWFGRSSNSTFPLFFIYKNSNKTWLTIM